MSKRKKGLNSDEDAGKTVDFGGAISQICEEKGIARDKVIETIEAALSAAYKKDYGKKGQNIRAAFNEKNGEAEFYLVKETVDETLREFPVEEEEAEVEEKESKKKTNLPALPTGRQTARQGKVEKKEEPILDEERLPRFNPERDFTLAEAKKIQKDAKVGTIIEIKLEPRSDYGRVAAQTAKQVIIQRIREAERDAMYDEYKDKEGEVVSGVVQRVEGRNVIIDLGKSVGVLFPSEQVERESYRIGQRLKVYIGKVEAGSKGPGITLSRIHPQMVKKLFELEVPEIFSGVVEVKAIAREAGERTKIAVASNEEGIDPIGSCVGQKGTRVQAIIDELGGEKIDIILWNDDIAKFIGAALSPAKVLKVDVRENKKEAVVSVPEDQLSLAIGKRGQNVRLAAKLTEWKIDILGVKQDGEAVPVEVVKEKTKGATKPEEAPVAEEKIAEIKSEEIAVEEKPEKKTKKVEVKEAE
ncbi:transcription termination factor NusA [Patescibacteria group bacterium]|nr:transcription termination factor NusA [Patescibacteria group bacterium]